MHRNVCFLSTQVGDAVAPGDAVAEIETDKASVAFEAQDDGFIAALLHPAGTEDIAVGTPIAVVVEEEEDVAAFANFTLADAGGAAEPGPAPAPAPAAEAPAPAQQRCVLWVSILRCCVAIWMGGGWG